MMKYAFLLSKENLELARGEVESFLGAGELKGNLLLINTSKRFDFQRLAFTKAVYKVLFVTNKKNLLKNMESFSWDKFYKGSFCLRTNNKDNPEAKLAGYIWRNVKNPKVDLSNPKTSIELFFAGKIYCCLLVEKIDRNFFKRRGHLRPENHPTTLSPKLAASLINLTGIKKGVVFDPFCGGGGILIEAGIMGFKTIGWDIDGRMLGKCKKNLDFFKIKNYELSKRDALSLDKKVDYVITDLPYGLNSKLLNSLRIKSITKKIDKKNLELFYFEFLKKLKKYLKKKAVVIFPDFVDYHKLIKNANLRLEKEFSWYIHRSLTKKITVLSKSLIKPNE